MMTWASVLLPEPFLPMMAWTSPALMVRSTPLRISRPPGAATRAWRLFTSRRAISMSFFLARLFTLDSRHHLFDGNARAILPSPFLNHLPECGIGHITDVFLIIKR